MSYLEVEATVNVKTVLEKIILEIQSQNDEINSQILEDFLEGLSNEGIEIPETIDMKVKVDEDIVLEEVDENKMVEHLKFNDYKVLESHETINFSNMPIPDKHDKEFKKMLLEIFGLREYCGREELINEILEIYK